MKKLLIILLIISAQAKGQTSYDINIQDPKIATLQTQVSTLKLQVATLQSQVATLQKSYLNQLPDSIKQLVAKRKADSTFNAWAMDGLFAQFLTLKASMKPDTITSNQIIMARSGVDGSIVTMSIPDLDAALLRLQAIEAILNRLKQSF